MDKTNKDIEQLLRDQTAVILESVETIVEKRLSVFEDRFNHKIDRLVTTLDAFLKRLTDTEQEFTFMKNEIDRIKAVLKEKLGVDI
ncbi:MAG: hypothetical protein Q7S28_02430 [bacterium]|nr:hypothetical protein [bacterium]